MEMMTHGDDDADQLAPICVADKPNEAASDKGIRQVRMPPAVCTLSVYSGVVHFIQREYAKVGIEICRPHASISPVP